jgi:hypothetical protein
LVSFLDFDVFYWSGKIKLGHVWSWKRGAWNVYDQSTAELYLLFIDKIDKWIYRKSSFFLPGMQSNTGLWINNVFLHSVHPPDWIIWWCDQSAEDAYSPRPWHLILPK